MRVYKILTFKIQNSLNKLWSSSHKVLYNIRKNILLLNGVDRIATGIIVIYTRSYNGRCFKLVPMFICTVKDQGCTWSKTLYSRDIIVFHFYFFLCFRTFQYIFGTNHILVKGRVLGVTIHTSIPFVDVP